MERRGQNKELEMPTTLAYNSSSSSKLSSPTLASTTVGERSHEQQPSQTHTTTTTLIFNDPPQTHHQHHPLYPPPHLVPPNNQLHQSQRPSTDPDLSSPSNPIATTSITTSTPISSNLTRTPPTITTPQTPATTTTTAAATASSTPLIRYRECLRNHAASMGSHVVDGCGEFMPSGEEGTPESLRCAACECHRNFHRKEVEGSPQQHHHHASSNFQSYYPNKHNGHSNLPSPHLQFHTPSSSLHQHHRFSHGVAAANTHSGGGLVQPVMMTFGGGGGGAAESSSEDLNMFQSGGQLSVQAPLSKKRFRTKFTQNQKDRMMEFAEKLGWKIQKHDEHEVQQFCSQVGVKRQVFKVWMHNNKQAIKKQQQM